MYSSYGKCWQSPTWKEFHERVVVELQVNKQKYQLPATDENTPQLIGYFEGVVDKVDALKEKAHAGTLKYRIPRDVIDMLVRLPHTVLENTDAVATDLKNMLSSEWADQSVLLGRVPDCGVIFGERHFIHSEKERFFRDIKNGDKIGFDSILKYEHLPVQRPDPPQEVLLLDRALPKDLNSPFRVAFVLALECVGKSLRDKPDARAADEGVVDKLARYLKSFLEVTPGREVIFGAVTNLQECVFVAVQAYEPNQYAAERTYERYQSSVMGRDTVARELASFCASTPFAMGLDPELYHSPFLTVQSCWDNDSSGVLLQCRWKEDVIALKVSVCKEALDLERALLLYLEARGATNVPRIHKQAQKDLFPCYIQSCTAFETILERKETALSEAQLLKVWDVLSSLHREGIVHRDVRAENLRRDKEGNMFLTSFRAAQFYKYLPPDARAQLQATAGVSLEELEGLCDPRNANTASNAVLWHGYRTLPADEACALIYTALQVNFPNSTVNVNQLPPGVVPDGYPMGTFLRLRNQWYLHLWRKKDVPALIIKPDIDMVVISLADLGKRRADDSYTADDIRVAVHSAVKAVYRLKRSVDEAMSAAAAAEKARGMRTRATAAAAVATSECQKTNVFDYEAYSILLMKAAELEPRAKDVEAKRKAAELAALVITQVPPVSPAPLYAKRAEEERSAASSTHQPTAIDTDSHTKLKSECETNVSKAEAVPSQCVADRCDGTDKRSRLK